MKISKTKLNETLKFVQDISYDAGEILLKYQKKRQTLAIKDKGREGIASEADLKSEEFIISAIQEKFPKHYILSEENKSKGIKESQKAEYAWVIDPLDGTNNFVNGIPIFATSIALLEKGRPILGVVYNPSSGECFFASKGNGAYLIDFRINPLKKFHLDNKENKKEMRECIFSPAPVYEIEDRFERQLSTFRKNIIGARAVRRLGSAALELCYVANGNFDAYWEKNLKPWDVAAADIICRESGIKITEFGGNPFSPFKDSVIAAARPLHGRILGKIQK